MTQTHLFSVLRDFTREVYPHTGSGMRSGYSITLTREYALPLREVDTRDAPVVATLGFHDGHRIALRSHEGRLFRPVLAPQSHRACTVETFAEACRGEVSWRDDPFATKDPYGDSTHVAKPVSDRVSDRADEVWRKVGSDTSAKVEEDLRLRGADLLVADGIVHVACPQPVLVLKALANIDDRHVGNLLTWTLPALEGDDHHVTGPTTHKPLQSYEKDQIKNGRTPTRHRRSFAKAPWRFFGLDDLASAAAFGEALSDKQGVPFSVAEGLSVVIDPSAFAPVPGPDPRAVAKAFLNDVGGKLEHHDRPFVEAWLDARDALRAGDAERAIRLMATAADGVSPGTEAHKGLHWAPHSVDSELWPGAAMLLRYVSVDGKRAPDPDATREDEASLAELAMAP